MSLTRYMLIVVFYIYRIILCISSSCCLKNKLMKLIYIVLVCFLSCVPHSAPSSCSKAAGNSCTDLSSYQQNHQLMQAACVRSKISVAVAHELLHNFCQMECPFLGAQLMSRWPACSSVDPHTSWSAGSEGRCHTLKFNNLIKFNWKCAPNIIYTLYYFK